MKPLLEVENLRKTFRVPGSGDQRLIAVDDVSFTLNSGETLGLVGELFGERSTFVGGMVFASLGLLLLARTRQQSSPTIAV